MEGQPRCECPPTYFRTIPGLLKIVEIIFTILTFAISFGCIWWSHLGGGWVEFTGIISFIIITCWLILHLINWIPQIFLNLLLEIICYCIMTVILLISGIVAAARAETAGFYWDCKSTVGATSFFAFAAAITCGVDAILQFMAYRGGNVHTSATATTVTTTTTSSTAANVEY